MKRIKIINTALPELFPLGLGTVGAGKKWDGEDAYRIFNTYLSHGGNVFDTARVYSIIAKSEPVIGDWFLKSGKRQDVVLISKGGHASLDIRPWDMHKVRLSYEEMLSDLDESLQALKTDYIDIYLYHRDDPSRSIEELIETMEAFVKQGKIRYYGCSNWSLNRIKEAMFYCDQKGYRGFVMNQSLLNIGSDYMNPPMDDTLQIIDKPMQNYHEEENRILATAFSSNCGGFFQQYITGGEAAVRDKSYLTEENRKSAQMIKKLAEKEHISILQVVMKYFTQLPFDCLPLFGPRDPENLIDAMKAFE